MAYSPVQLFSTPFEDYAGYWVKFYEQSTVTPLSMATDATGGTTLAKAEISSGGTVEIGFIKTAGDALLNPFVDGDYDCWLFPTSTEADANDTTNATQVADNLNADPLNSIFNSDTIESIAALKLVEGIANQRVDVLSYYAPNFALANPYDGGGGQFAWDATSIEVDNGGTVIKVTAVATGRWIRIYDQPVNVKWFGATGDGTTDDYASIVNAIAAGKESYFPEGDYYIGTSTLTIAGKRVIGAGNDIWNDGVYEQVRIKSDATGFAVNLTNSFMEGIDVYAAGNGMFVYGTRTEVQRVGVYSSNISAAGSIGVRLGDGTLTNPCYYSRLKFTRIRGFRQGLVLLKYANANIVSSQIVNSGVGVDGTIDNYIYIYGANANQLEVGLESGATTTGYAIYIQDNVGCAGNYIRAYWEFGADEYVRFDGNNNTHANLVEVVDRGGYGGASYSAGNAVGNIARRIANIVPISYHWEGVNNINLVRNINFALNPSNGRPLEWSLQVGTGSVVKSDLHGFNAYKVSATDPYSDYTFSAEDLELMKGRKVVISGMLKSSVAGVKIVIIGTVSGTHNSGTTQAADTYEVLTSKVYVDPSETSLKFRIFGGSLGGTWDWHLVLPMVTVGDDQSSVNPPYLNDGKAQMYGPFISTPKLEFTDGDTTPDVSDGNVYKTANTGATTITNFDGGSENQEITIIFTDANTTLSDAGNLKLAGGFTSTADDTMKLIYDVTNWYEVSRSVN